MRPFGDETITAHRTQYPGYQPHIIRQDYTGYQKDSESGLEFAQARYYNTQHGRFTSVDPLTASATIKNPQTLNRYSYVLNSPYKFVDPLGFMAFFSGIAGNVCSAEVNNCNGSGNNELGDFPYRHAINTGRASVRAQESRGSNGNQPVAENPDPPPPPNSENDDSPEEIDTKLTSLLTDTGTVIGANSPHLKHYKTGEVQDNHTQFANGVVHTVHVAGKDAGVFIPKGFTDVMITSKDTVVARNPKTGEVFMIAHVQVGSGKAGLTLLKENMKTVRANGTMYIGKTGGRGGEGADPVSPADRGSPPHSHIQYHPNEPARLRAYNQIVADRKAAGTNNPDFTQKRYGSLVSDFRKLVQ